MAFRGDWRRAGLAKEELVILYDFVEYASRFFALDSVRSRMDGLDLVISWGRSPYKAGQTSYDAGNKRGKVEIFLKGLGESPSIDSAMLVLSHEMIHCKQWGFSELDWRNTEVGKFLMWEKSPYNHTGSKAFKAYADAPWEREAFENQGNLLEWYRNTRLAEL